MSSISFVCSTDRKHMIDDTFNSYCVSRIAHQNNIFLVKTTGNHNFYTLKMKSG